MAWETERVILARFYSEGSVAAAMRVMAGKTTKPFTVHLALDKSISLDPVLMSISIGPHLICVLSCWLGIDPIFL